MFLRHRRDVRCLSPPTAQKFNIDITMAIVAESAPAAQVVVLPKLFESVEVQHCGLVWVRRLMELQVVAID